MKKLRIFIDILMLIVLILSYNVELSGVLLHEILGISIFVLFFIHLFLNFKWIKRVTTNYNKINIQTRKLYIIDLLLFISFVVICITGLGISQYLFVFLNVSDIYLFTNIHLYASYVSVLLIVIHMFMHFKFFENIVKKLNLKIKSNILTFILILLSSFILLSSSISSRLKEIFINKLDETEYSSEVIDEVNEEVSEDPEEIVEEVDEVVEDTEEETDTSNSVEEDSSTSTNSSVSETESDEPTLLEYLGKLVCTGCSRRCPLSHPQCGRGETQAEAATADYNELYS